MRGPAMPQGHSFLLPLPNKGLRSAADIHGMLSTSKTALPHNEQQTALLNSAQSNELSVFEEACGKPLPVYIIAHSQPGLYVTKAAFAQEHGQ